MPTVTMPQLGESVAEGTIGKWLKAVGEHVSVGDPLVEVITDKVNAEVPSPFEGTLTRILVAEGETVANDAAIAEVDAGAAAGPPAAAVERTAPEAGAAAAPAPVGPTETPAVSASPTAPVAAAPEPGHAGTFVPSAARMTPAVRRLAREHGVDLSRVGGSGMGGRVTRADVERAIAGTPAGAVAPEVAPAPAPAPALVVPSAPTGPAPVTPPAAAPPAAPPVEGDVLKRLSPMRRAIAAQMTRALQVPQAYITIEVDMTPVVRRRERLKRDYEAREGVGLSFVAFVTKACVEALRKHPEFNAHWTDEGHWLRKAVNVGIAVAVEDGLVVPVIRDADALSLHGLNLAINDLAARARAKKLAPEDMQGGTFTVDNTGWTGSILTLPIINVPEVAIVTMEKIVKRPVVVDGPSGEAIAVRSMMNMCIAIDHRATDGAQAGAFLADVRSWLEAVDDSTPIW